MTNAGLVDSFRQLRPDVINDRGETWTPGSPAPEHRPPTRFMTGSTLFITPGQFVTPLSAVTLGYNANDGKTDIGIQPYPSDHRAVVVNFDIPNCSLLGDLNGNCSIGVEDWTQFRAGQLVNLAALTHSQAYAMGDLNGDFRNDHADFVIFKAAFEAAHGTGSFATMLASVPEPSAFLLVAGANFGWCIAGRRSRRSLTGRGFRGLRPASSFAREFPSRRPQPATFAA